MNLTGGLGGFGAALDGPGTALLLAVGQEGDEAQQGIAGGDEPVQTGAGQAQVLHEHGPVLGVHLGKVLLGLGTDGDDLGPLGVGTGLHLLIVLVVLRVGHTVVVHIAGVNNGLSGQQTHFPQGQGLFFVALVHGEGPGALTLTQMLHQRLQPFALGLCGFVAGLGGLGEPVQPVLGQLQVGEDQLHVDGLNVPVRVHGHRLGGVLHHMDDVVVVKAADHMDDGVALPDVAQELVAQACALAGTFHQTGNVHEFHHGGGLLGGLPQLGQLVQPGVRHGHDARVGVDGAEGVVGRLCVAGAGNGVEQSGLAHIGQSHDT